MTTFNPDVGSRLPGNYEKVYNSDAPTIGLVSTAYGRDLSLQWINIQLNSIDQFTQVKNDLPESSRKELAELILSHYSALKLPEFMLFVARFKLGLYGKFYGSFDPIAFCEAIKSSCLIGLLNLNGCASGRGKRSRRKGICAAGGIHLVKLVSVFKTTGTGRRCKRNRTIKTT